MLLYFRISSVCAAGHTRAPICKAIPHRTARAGPSNVTRNSSPLVNTSRPLCQAMAPSPGVRGIELFFAHVRSSTAESVSVEPTRSVKNTVASTRSTVGVWARVRQELLDLVETLAVVAKLPVVPRVARQRAVVPPAA